MRGMSAPGTTVQTRPTRFLGSYFALFRLRDCCYCRTNMRGWHLWGRLSMELRRVRCFCLCLIVLLGTVQLWADVTGSILGYVRDPSGAVLPNATVTAIQTATGYSRAVVSDASGQYSMLALLPGRYRLSASVPSFR